MALTIQFIWAVLCDSVTLCICGQSSSRNQSQLFSQLHCLGSAPGAQLVEQAAGMGLDGVFADEEFFGDLAIAQTDGNQFEYLQFAAGYAKFAQFYFF